MHPDVSIIVVNWNTRDLTLACLESIKRETTKSSWEVIVVDNHSSDGSAATITEHAPYATLLAMDENLGFARANNHAASHARGRYILLLNPDTLIMDGAIDRLVSFAGCMPDARIWGGRTLFGDRTLNPSSCSASMTPWHQVCQVSGLSKLLPNTEFFNGEAYGGWQRDTVRHVDIVSSSFLMIDANLWRELGGFDLSLYMYGEDADLCHRAAKLGATPFITPTAEIIHYSGGAAQTRAGQLIKLLTAKATLVRKHWPLGTHWIGRTLLEAWPVTRWFATKTLNRLFPCHAYNEQAEAWGQVLAARKTWRQGYRTHTSQAWAATAAATAIAQPQAQIQALKAG